MKFSLSWLKAHLDTDASIQDVADVLNRIGLEVEGIENPAERLKGFTVRPARMLQNGVMQHLPMYNGMSGCQESWYTQSILKQRVKRASE